MSTNNQNIQTNFIDNNKKKQQHQFSLVNQNKQKTKNLQNKHYQIKSN